MTGEKNMTTLLSSMSPELIDGEFVFCSFGNAKYGDHSQLDPIATLMEEEGLTLVISKRKAQEYGVAFESVFRCITLRVHSSLDAVGLTAAVSRRLAERGMAANMIAGYFHDHVFVATDTAEKALAAMEEFALEGENSE
jgi:hypothetical protein